MVSISFLGTRLQWLCPELISLIARFRLIASKNCYVFTRQRFSIFTPVTLPSSKCVTARCLATLAKKKKIAKSYWYNGDLKVLKSAFNSLPFYLQCFWDNDAVYLCPIALILYSFFKRVWLQCQKCTVVLLKKYALHLKKLKKVLSSVSMWSGITAAPHWALKGLSRKWMFWLNSSHLKIVVGVNGGQNRGGLCQAEPVKLPRKTQEQESCRAPQIEQLMSPQGITTVGAIPLQERWNNFTGALAVCACLHCRNLPRRAIHRNINGPESLHQGRYLDRPSKSPGSRFTQHWLGERSDAIGNDRNKRFWILLGDAFSRSQRPPPSTRTRNMATASAPSIFTSLPIVVFFVFDFGSSPRAPTPERSYDHPEVQARETAPVRFPPQYLPGTPAVNIRLAE